MRKIKKSILATGLVLALANQNAFSKENNNNLPFVWQNANVYFVITDRFNNGDTSNDHSYGRPSVDSSGYNAGTFHGGDFKGLTERLDYIQSLGVNAIWVTAPYEQIHGWVGGGPMGMYQYYSYHGYWALDFTSMDANLGKIEDFRNFVTEAHKRGIRVMIDVVLNHVGYSNLKDMCDFSLGKTKDGFDACKTFTLEEGSDQSYHNKPIDEGQDEAWNKWWGKDWVKHGGYGEICSADDAIDKCLAYLPDLKNYKRDEPIVKVPQFLQEKWSKVNTDYDVPAVLDKRQGEKSVAQFQTDWLAAWVEEFGIDGFRCDTVKFVDKEMWKLLKDKSVVALEKWREKNKGKDVAADWTDKFYMTGELWGFTYDPEDKSEFASKGGFDSLIDFNFNPDGVNMNTCLTPDADDWDKYGQRYGRLEGKVALGNLTYISSHDTSLCRKKDMAKTALRFLMLPGATQIFYGDETNRQNDMGGGIDLEQGMRSDMNFPADIADQAKWAAKVATLSTDFSADNVLATWQKVGQFRLRNPAVGAGEQTKLEDGSFCRHYIDKAKNIDNKVVVHLGDVTEVLVGKCFADGTVLDDGLTGLTYTVKNGKVEGDFKLGAILEVKR